MYGTDPEATEGQPEQPQKIELSNRPSCTARSLSLPEVTVDVRTAGDIGLSKTVQSGPVVVPVDDDAVVLPYTPIQVRWHGLVCIFPSEPC